MFQVGPDLQENALPPRFTAKALFAIVIPVLGGGTERQCPDNYACCKDSLHALIPSTIIAESAGRESDMLRPRGRPVCKRIIENVVICSCGSGGLTAFDTDSN